MIVRLRGRRAYRVTYLSTRGVIALCVAAFIFPLAMALFFAAVLP